MTASMPEDTAKRGLATAHRTAASARIKATSRRVLAAWLVLVIGLLSTIAVSVWAWWQFHERDRRRFDTSVLQTSNAIIARVETYIALLRGGAGLFAATDSVSATQFRTFVN